MIFAHPLNVECCSVGLLAGGGEHNRLKLVFHFISKFTGFTLRAGTKN